jgi:hypothetical protein
MPHIAADNVEITIKDGFWKIFSTTGKHTLTPFFTAVRGNGVVNYNPAFGEARQLPGDVLSTEYIHAVVVGFDDQRHRWMLGFQVSITQDEKARFVGLAQWPEGDNSQYALEGQTAGRALAEYIARPLKLLGTKKVPAADLRRTITGPLESHKRYDIDLATVLFKARKIQVPMSMGDLMLTRNKNVLTLRNPKDSTTTKGGEEMPAYALCTFDLDNKLIKLLPPTGLLGSFFGPSGRQLKFEQVRNVELRHIIGYEAAAEKADDGTMIDLSRQRHRFSVHLTLKDETILLLRQEHIVDPRLTTNTMRAVQIGMGAGQHEIADEVRRLKQFERESSSMDQKAEITENITIILAGSIGVPMVKTSVGDINDD